MIKKEEIEKLALSIETAESAELAARLGAALGERFGMRDETPFSILARGEDGTLIGGINGLIHWRWAYVRHLWVAESRRGQGLGARLMGEAERLARDRGCVGVYIDTFRNASPHSMRGSASRAWAKSSIFRRATAASP